MRKEPAVELKIGAKLRSQVGPTEAVVVKAPPGDVVITCGGHPMITPDQSPQEGLTVDADGQTQLGKRYTDPEGTVELLVTKPGPGALAAGGAVLDLKQAKPLPASD
jgi:hypothetical protein